MHLTQLTRAPAGSADPAVGQNPPVPPLAVPGGAGGRAESMNNSPVPLQGQQILLWGKTHPFPPLPCQGGQAAEQRA